MALDGLFMMETWLRGSDEAENKAVWCMHVNDIQPLKQYTACIFKRFHAPFRIHRLHLRVLMYCAAHRDRLVTIGELAEQHGLSKNHLMKVVNDLARQGLLETTRGRGGGLRLLAEPETDPHRRCGAGHRDRLSPGGVFRLHDQRLHADAQPAG
jgi:AraC-like DNA-binding protein